MKARRENNQQENIEQMRKKPEGNVPAQNQKDGVSNESNYKGAVNTGQHGTQATASQQQGQGLKGAHDPSNRDGSDSGQNTNKKKS